MRALGFEFKQWKFPAGELGIRVTRPHEFVKHKIIMLENGSSDEIVGALLLADALKCLNLDFFVEVNAQYLPYSRQDRACTVGEPYSSAVVVDLLASSPNVDNVVTFDTHSKNSVPDHYKGQVVEIPLTPEFVLSKFSYTDPIILFPDKGAREKYSEQFKGYESTYADKVREPATGKILEIKVANPDLLRTRDVIVVDDICDGGGTFIGLAEQVKGLPKTLNLFVSHGIFSKGMDELNKHYDEIQYFHKVNTNV